MSDEKCFQCGAPARRQRDVVVKRVDHEHRDHFPSRHHGTGLAHGHHHGHHHHREVVRELRPVCDACDAKIAADEEAVAKAAVGIFGAVALMAILPFVLIALTAIGIAGVVAWLFLRAG